MTKVFGIRHHGPGSAKALLTALRNMQPDCIVLEMPADTASVIDYVANPNIKPPVAVLAYNDKNLKQAAYIPFASFSPEWQAIKYALQQDIPVQCADLPMSMSFALANADTNQQSLSLEQNLSAKDEDFRRDPMRHLANLAGYTDSERWWEVMFEQSDNETFIFDVILEMITALRNEVRQEKPETLRREAHMRKTIRKAVKDGFQNIAIICGAWHAPALHQWQRYTIKQDNALLKGIKRVKTKATWIPWSYNRLTFQSGYMSGVKSPAWYQLLFHKRKESTIRWLVKVARLFRGRDIATSSAHVIEATRLAEMLASLRGLYLPGIEEMKEAAVSVFCNGDELKMGLINEKLIIGDVMGKVPPEIPMIPLQKDLEKQIKSARLTAYKESSTDIWLKATAANKRGGLDLRVPADLLKSHLLHRLNLLDIPWGKQQKETGRELSTFKEYWKLKWKPDFALSIVAAGMWGNTVQEAAENFLGHVANEADSLSKLTELTEGAINANLPQTIPLLMQLLEQKAALTADVIKLTQALPTLARIIRYGNVRGTTPASVKMVTEQIVPRICIGFPTACIDLNDEAVKPVLETLIAVSHALNLLNNISFNENWQQCLLQITKTPQTHPTLKGIALRFLYDKGILGIEKVANETHFNLSTGQKPSVAAEWLEGFLYGSGLVVIHHDELWQILDDWISNINNNSFNAILPILRRTFAEFSRYEREAMMRLVKGKKRHSQNEIQIAKERAELITPTIKELLGY